MGFNVGPFGIFEVYLSAYDFRNLVVNSKNVLEAYLLSNGSLFPAMNAEGKPEVSPLVVETLVSVVGPCSLLPVSLTARLLFVVLVELWGILEVFLVAYGFLVVLVDSCGNLEVFLVVYGLLVALVEP